MTHHCLLANRGNVLQRLLVAHFHYFSFLCRNEHWNTIRHVLLNCVDEKSRQILLPAAFLAFSLASSLAFLLASTSFCCCSILSSFHRLLICKQETVSFSLNAVNGTQNKVKMRAATLPQIFLKTGQTWRSCWRAHHWRVNTVTANKEINPGCWDEWNVNHTDCVASHHSERVFERLDDSSRLHLSHREGFWVFGGFQLLQTEAEIQHYVSVLRTEKK